MANENIIKLEEEHVHTWVNQWDKRFCLECEVVEQFVEEELENVKPTKGSGKRAGNKSDEPGQDKGTGGTEATNVGTTPPDVSK